PEFTDAGKFGAREGEVLDIHHSDPDASAAIGGKFHLAPPLPGRDGADPDLLVAELRVKENTARRLDEWFVGAIVVAEGVGLRRGSDGFEVGVDIPAAEGVDRLLRVADEDEVALAVEGGFEDPPLRVVRVL